MRLLRADCLGYKRFRKTQEMDLYPSLVCIVGPNAAGKSSFLDALTHLNDDRAFESWELTRHAGAGATTQVRAHFELDDDDRAALAQIPEAREAGELVVWKKSGSSRGFEIVPEPLRDLRLRADMRDRLRKLAEHKWVVDRDEEDPFGAVLTAAIAAVSGDGDLSEEEIRALEDLISHLGSSSDTPHLFRTLPERLVSLVEHERKPNPNGTAMQVLQGRMPTFMKFSEGDRGLQATYDLNEGSSAAIDNLLAFAGTTWSEMGEVIEGGDPGKKVQWMDRANETLAQRLDPSWGQSKLTVRLDLDGRVLKVLMAMETDDFIEIDQQSDGLRQFIALMAFMAIRGIANKPIVLIDEAETHLHYDAQADLVRVLEDQRGAAKIIYTTHSAGCLPRDLGTGIRAIVPVVEEGEARRQTDDSRVENSFWTRGHGFSPLLMQMGASAFAFASTQRAVVCEGMTDALLLPTLIREATGVEVIRYQFAPGASEASRAEIPELDLAAARVVFLLDGDRGGRDQAKKVRRGGALPGQVIHLGDKTDGLAVEDLLAKEVYLQGVNEQLAAVRPGLQMSPEEIPDSGRGSAVVEWCAQHSIELSKVAIAQRVLDQRHDHKLLARAHRSLVKNLDAELNDLLSKPTHKLATPGDAD
jgi:hypothetical protein